MNHTIVVSGLTKLYGKPASGVLAVDHISFDVVQGEIFGFLGPNGAGKTTTIRMLTGLTRPTEGSAAVLGFDLARETTRIKKHIGVVAEQSNLYDELTALDNLVFVMQLYGVPRGERKQRAEELLVRFRLADKKDVRFDRLSRGTRRALTVAAALVHDPQVLFLDEPTTGLDVVSARNLRAMIAELRTAGVTIFLTTHFLEEAERLCDRVALIVRGRIVALDTVNGLKGQAKGSPAVEVTVRDRRGAVETLRVDGHDVEVSVRSALDRATSEGKEVLAIDTLRPSLEDAFIQLTGLSPEVMLVDKGGRRPGSAGG